MTPRRVPLWLQFVEHMSLSQGVVSLLHHVQFDHRGECWLRCHGGVWLVLYQADVICRLEHKYRLSQRSVDQLKDKHGDNQTFDGQQLWNYAREEACEDGDAPVEPESARSSALVRTISGPSVSLKRWAPCEDVW